MIEVQTVDATIRHADGAVNGVFTLATGTDTSGFTVIAPESLQTEINRLNGMVTP